MVVDINDFELFAEDHGWDREIAHLYFEAFSVQDADDPAQVWQRLRSSNREFELASFGLGWEVSNAERSTAYPVRNTIRRLVSRQQTSAAFPLTQYLRELMQNAIDVSVDGQMLAISFSVAENQMTFEHNGRSFLGPSQSSRLGEMGALLPVGETTKRGNFHSVGKFGIGFKGWMLFFDTIKHQHSDGTRSVGIQYSLPSDQLRDVTIHGPEEMENPDQIRKTKFVFSDVRDGRTEDLSGLTAESILTEWLPMIRFVDKNISISLNIHGVEREISHSAEELEPMNDENFRILQFQTPIQQPLLFKCMYEEGDCSPNNLFSAPHGFDVSDNLPDCPECGDAQDVVRLEPENEFLIEKTIAIQGRVQPQDEITECVQQYIREESRQFESENEANNPWGSVTPTNWYSQVKMHFGIQVNQQSDLPKPWLFSLAEITSSTGWIHGDMETLHEKTPWCLDGPFFLDPDREHLDHETQLSRSANRLLMKQFLTRFVGRLARYLHNNEDLESIPLNSPFDRMINTHVEQGLDTWFSSLIQNANEDGEDQKLITYSELFGGFAIFQNSVSEQINPNVARRIPEAWHLPGGRPVFEWLSEVGDLTHWPDIPAHITEQVDILNTDLAPLLYTLPEFTNAEFYQRMVECNLWERLSNEHQDLLNCDWIRLPLPEGTLAIVGATQGWPAPLNLLINEMKNEGVLFTDDVSVINNYSANDVAGRWTVARGLPTLRIPTEAEDSWWYNQLIAKSIEIGIQAPPSFFDEIQAYLEDETADFFLGDIMHFPSGANTSPAIHGRALVPFSHPGRSKQEQTYALRFGSSYTFRTGGTGGALWRNFPDENLEKVVDTKQMMFQVGTTHHGTFNNEPMILIGYPINPFAIIELYISLLGVPEHSTMRGGFLIVNPQVNQDNLTRLRQQNWTKLPTISFSVDPLKYEFVWGEGLDYKGNEEYGNDSWNHKWEENVHRNVKHHENNQFYGRFMRLRHHASRSKEFIVRRLPMDQIYGHPEFTDSFHENTPRISIILQLNKARFSRNPAALRYVKMYRGGRNSSYSLIVANIMTPAQANLNEGMRRNLRVLDLEQFSVFTEANLAGFTLPIALENPPWLLSLDTLDGFIDEFELFEEILNDLDDVALISPSDICGITPETIEDSTDGLARGLRGLFDAVLIENGLIEDIIVPIAILFQKIEAFRGDTASEAFFQKHETAISVNHVPHLLSLVQAAINANHGDDAAEALIQFQTALQNYTGRTWDDLLARWDSSLNAQEQWELFVEFGGLPNPAPVYGLDVQRQVFTKRPTQARRNDTFVYVSIKDARDLFHIYGQDARYDANRWILNDSRRLYLVDERMKQMLPATPVHVPHNISLPQFTEICSRLNLDPRWSFVQALIAMQYAKTHQVDITEPNDLIRLFPNVESVERSHPCSIFGHTHIQVGQFGWNIEPGGSNGGLVLQTAIPPAGSKGTLRSFLNRLGIRMNLLSNSSFTTSAGLISLSAAFNLETDLLRSVYDIICRDEGLNGQEVLNPWGFGEQGNEEGRRWEEAYQVPPQWEGDMVLTHLVDGAREVLERYKAALSVLLQRRDLGPADRSENSDQLKLRQFGSIRDVLKRSLYTNTSSMVCDEPILYIPDEGVPTMGNAQRYLHSARRSLLIENAGLRYYLGNQLFLSQYMRHRATMTTDAFGLRERPENTIQTSIHRLLHDQETWGDEETVVLRDVMQAGDGNHLSLRVHKYHAICMCALDDALDEIEAE